jgi:hypothetical protein
MNTNIETKLRGLQFVTSRYVGALRNNSEEATWRKVFTIKRT